MNPHAGSNLRNLEIEIEMTLSLTDYFCAFLTHSKNNKPLFI
jgi:hypothetical protein